MFLVNQRTFNGETESQKCAGLLETRLCSYAILPAFKLSLFHTPAFWLLLSMSGNRAFPGHLFP